MNAELKRCVDSKLLIDQFINKFKMIVDAYENQYGDTISHTADFSFSNKYKNWSRMVNVGCSKVQTLSETLSEKDILSASEYVNFERNANQDVSVLDNLYSKDLPDQIPENVPDKIITDTKALIFNKYIRQSFNGLDYDVSFSHRIGP